MTEVKYKHLEIREGYWRFKQAKAYPISIIQAMYLGGNSIEKTAKALKIPVAAIKEAIQLFENASEEEKNRYPE